MDIIINNAILHVLNNDGGKSYISNQELDIDSDTCYEFITKHVKKLMNNPACREATFADGSDVYEAIQAFKSGEVYFKETAVKIGQKLADIMQKHVDIPSGDLLIAQFENKGEAYLAVLKLNYKEYFTHEIQLDAEGDAADNQIVKCRTALPFDGGKVEEAVLIPYDPMVLRVLEKPYPVDGEPTYYFSSLFLACEPEISKKEAAQIIQEITEEITAKYYNDSAKELARAKAAVIEEAEDEDGALRLESVAARAFGDNEEARDAYVERAREAGLRADLILGESFVRQQFGRHTFKAENGVEVKFPAELSDDTDAMEFITEPDGTTTIILKRLRKK